MAPPARLNPQTENNMKPINKEELYENLSEYLKTKGVSLQDGSYSRGIHAGCSFLADAINLSQAGLKRAKSEIEKQLDNARQIIHEKTARKSSTSGSTGAKRSGNPRTSPNSKTGPGRKKTDGRKPKRP
jgi:hypothetical protein